MANRSQATRELWRLVETRPGEPDTYPQAQGWIGAGADITVETRSRYMIQIVVDALNQYRSTDPARAHNCWLLYNLLKDQASKLLADAIFTENTIDETRITFLISLYADTCQSSAYPPTGLLGTLLGKKTSDIRLPIIQKLIESDAQSKAGLLLEGANHKQSCLSLAKHHSLCSPEIVNYLQEQLDRHLNSAPFEQTDVPLEHIASWIRIGARTTYVDKAGNSVLIKAVIANKVELVRVLVEYDADPMQCNANQQSAMDIAKSAQPQNPPLCNCLKSRILTNDLKQLIKSKKSSLTMEEIRNQVKRGAEVRFMHEHCQSLLQVLIINQCSSEVIKICINEFDMKMNMMDSQDHRVFETCIISKHVSDTLLATLLGLDRVQSSMFYNEKLKKSLRQLAIDYKRVDAVKVIEKELHRRLWICVSKASTTKQEQEMKMIYDEIRQLITAGAQINHKHDEKNDCQGWTVLHLACQGWTKQGVEFLIQELKADVGIVTGKEGDYPIGIAAQYGRVDIVKYLQTLPKSNLNAANKMGEMPLHLATKNRHIEIVRFLILWGADHEAKTCNHQTALDIAKANNSSKNKQDEANDKLLVRMLERLICPPIIETSKNSTDTSLLQTKVPDDTLEICVMSDPIPIQAIPLINSYNKRSNSITGTSGGGGGGNANSALFDAATGGDLNGVQRALNGGADIFYRRSNQCAYNIVCEKMNRYQIEYQNVNPYTSRYNELQQIIGNYNEILRTIQAHGKERLSEAINESNASLFQACHQASGVLNKELLYEACSKSDNVEIVAYMIQDSSNVWWTETIYPTSTLSPYRTARRNKRKQVAAYLKYTLSIKCTQAVKENATALVKSLLEAGASPDLRDTDNVRVALEHKNVEMMQYLCQHGAKIPNEWKGQTLKSMPSDMVDVIEKCLLNRQLRLCAARGDLAGVIRCHRLGADINMRNCHGSTAVLCAIQHGNYFAIVHALVSAGASILHSNDDEPSSLMILAEKRKYDQIAKYLTGEVNRLLIITIINNDRASSEEYGGLGADFNHQDEQQRTALHYATQLHDVGLVKWLCESGCNPMIVDMHGDYPIMLATKKGKLDKNKMKEIICVLDVGDFAMVEYLVMKYPAVKSLRNKAGQNAQQIAAQLKYTQIEAFLKTGNASLINKGETGPKYSREQLVEAAQYGRMEIMKEFCDEVYKSGEEKQKLYYELIQTAKKARQHEVVKLLEPYYDVGLSERSSEPLDNKGQVVRMKEEYRKMLMGMLNGLGQVIAGCEIMLDPADPNTHKTLFSSLMDDVVKDSRDLSAANAEREIRSLISQALSECAGKQDTISTKLKELRSTKEKASVLLQETSRKLAVRKDLSAAECLEIMEMKEISQQELLTCDCLVSLYEREEEANANRKNTLQFIKESINLFMFYRTMENRLRTLFHRAISFKNGFKQPHESNQFNSTSPSSDTSMMFISLIADILTESTKNILWDVFCKLNKVQQKKEWLNISTLGQIGESERLASDIAKKMTIYYKEQIEAIDSSCRMKNDLIFDDKIKWIRGFSLQTDQRSSEEMAVVSFSDYVTGWIIDGLTGRRNDITSNKSLSHQVWLYVAKKNPLEGNQKRCASDILKAEAGGYIVTLINRTDTTNRSSSRVQLRYLMGYVSVVSDDGKVYEYDVLEGIQEEQWSNLAVFGYVYLALFSVDKKDLDSIVQGRKLRPAQHAANRGTHTETKDIMSASRIETASQSSVARSTAEQIAQVLRDQNIFLDAEVVKSTLNKAIKEANQDVNKLKERIQETEGNYEEKMATLEKEYNKKLKEKLHDMQKKNEEKYTELTSKLLEKMKELSHRMKSTTEQRLKDLETIYEQRLNELNSLVDTIKQDSQKTRENAKTANQTSKTMWEQTEQLHMKCKELNEYVMTEHNEYRTLSQKCEGEVQNTTKEQKEYLERMVNEYRQTLSQQIEEIKHSAMSAEALAQQTSKNADNLVTLARDTSNTMTKQLEIRKTEVKETSESLKKLDKKLDQCLKQSKDAENQGKKAEETITSAMAKVDKECRNMRDALKKLDDLQKKTTS